VTSTTVTVENGPPEGFTVSLREVWDRVDRTLALLEKPGPPFRLAEDAAVDAAELYALATIALAAEVRAARRDLSEAIHRVADVLGLE